MSRRKEELLHSVETITHGVLSTHDSQVSDRQPLDRLLFSTRMFGLWDISNFRGDNNLIMSTAKELECHCHRLQEGLTRNVSGSALNQLVENVTHALMNSLASGDSISVAGIDQRLTTRLQVLNALNQGFMIEATPASSGPQTNELQHSVVSDRYV